MSGLEELYQQDLILEHYRFPRGTTVLEHPDDKTFSHNPFCGDQVVIEVAWEGDRIRDISVRSTGCAISVASGSILSELVPGKTRREVEELHRIFKGKLQDEEPSSETLPEDLALLEGVRRFHARIKCALLPWKGLQELLDRRKEH